MALFAAFPRGDAKPLAKALLETFGDFANVVSAPEQKLRKVEGMGEAGIAALRVIEGAAHRLAQTEVLQKPILSNWDKVIAYCQARLGRADREHFRILFLNRKNVLIADEGQQSGTIDHTPIYPREVIKRALELDAGALILVHNHPSGDPEPSATDIQMTREIRSLAAGMDIQLHDHIVVARTGYRSFKEMGLL